MLSNRILAECLSPDLLNLWLEQGYALIQHALEVYISLYSDYLLSSTANNNI